ncbi:MAG: indolepyruvate ferredoxin oxidoreductase subunit alpha [Clostridia bacterium]
MAKKLMLGNEAIARGAYEAGVKLSSAYPGTPSTEISENIVKYKEIYSEWAPNEKVAMEVALGASISGVRAMASMKHVGVNVAADPLFTASYTGVNGGLVLVAADDPGLYSSQNEQDTRMVGRSALVPVIEPADSAEAKEFVKIAYKISEEYDTPVILRTTTRLSHSQCMVELIDREEREDIPYVKNTEKYVMMPAKAKKRHPIVEARMDKLAIDSCNMPVLNRAEYNDTKIGFITDGIAYQYIKEVLPNASVLKIGMVNPLPKNLIMEFASKVDKLYIFEELEPVIEEQVKSWGIKAIGKEIFTKQGEYSANMLRKEFLGQEIIREDLGNIPGRPPVLCPGCPHRSVYTALKQLKMHACGDIGCYTLGALEPLATLDTTICMGASISTLHGMQKAKGTEFIRDWVAVIGDSTFLHTGVNSLIGMVYNKGVGIVMILDNSTTGMTGHQDHAATGKTLNGEVTNAINLQTLCRAIGVKYVEEINAFDIPALKTAIKEAQKRDTITVIITKSPCVLLKSNHFTTKCIVDTTKCVKCGACLKPGCPALSKNDDGTIKIDPNMCNGCGLCMSLCKFGAITEVKA